MKRKSLILTTSKTIFLLFCMGSFFSCNTGNVNLGKNIQEIDGCEYIVSKNGYGNVVSHKGNCKNPIHYKVIHDTIYVVREK